MAILWDDNLITGLIAIDNQHKEIFNRFNKLLDACNKGKGREESINTFAFLEKYFITHFKTEEAIIYKYNYPYHMAHVAEHQLFGSIVKELKQELEQDGATGQFVLHLNKKIILWFIAHIGKEDKALAKFIRERS